MMSLIVKNCLSVIEMPFLYGADASKGQIYVFLVIKLPTESALGQICLGKWAMPSLAEVFHHVVVVCFVPEFSQRGWFPSSGKLTPVHNGPQQRGKNSETRNEKSIF